MATILTAPPYSFVQLADQSDIGCTQVKTGSMPISSLCNLACQFFVNTPAAAPEGCILIYGLWPLKIRQECFAPNSNANLAIEGNMESTATPGYDYMMDFGTCLHDFDFYAGSGSNINVGDCFHFAILEVAVNTTTFLQTAWNLLGCTNSFVRVKDDCYVARLQYTNGGNTAFGFDYTGFEEGFYNKVELPFYLRKPQNPTDESSYKKSDGSWIKVYSRTDLEWVLETDNIGADWHQKLAVALNHDTVQINSGYANDLIPNIQNESGFMNVVLSEKYEIDWPDNVPTFALAKGKAKVKNAQPVSLINNNC